MRMLLLVEFKKWPRGRPWKGQGGTSSLHLACEARGGVMWGVLGQSGRCAGSSVDWPFSAGMTNEAPLSRRLAGRLTVPHHLLAIGQPQIRYSGPNPPAHPCGLWFAQCFEVSNRVHYPWGLRARYLGGAPRTIWLVDSQRQRPAGWNSRWAGGEASNTQVGWPPA